MKQQRQKQQVPRNLDRTKARFFTKLGIVGPVLANRDQAATNKMTTKLKADNSDTTCTVNRFENPQEGSPLPSCLKKQRSVLHKKRPRNVSFFEEVIVTPIPSYRDYDPATHAALWNSTRFIKQEMKRNMLEFFADGRDWRNVTEEEGMVVAPDGSLIHPATWVLFLEEAVAEGYACGPYDYRNYFGAAVANIASYDDDGEYDLELPFYFDTHEQLPSYRSNVQRRRRKSWEKQPSQDNSRSARYYYDGLDSTKHYRVVDTSTECY